MRLLPEYGPVGRICLSFVHEFFNTRFGHGRVLCEIARAAQGHADVEIFVGNADLPHLTGCLNRAGLEPGDVTLTLDCPGRGFLAEYMPVFGLSESGTPQAIIFDCPRLDEPERVRAFADRFLAIHGIRSVEMPGGFGTAAIAVTEDVALISEAFAPAGDADPKAEFLRELCPHQSFHVVRPLPIEVGFDLDMFLWPIGSATWIGSEYPSGSPQAEAMAPILRRLRQHGHTVHPVPGLAPLVFDDVKTTPTYTNGVILNSAALIPVYNRPEDHVAIDLMNRLGFEVCPVDCSDVILSGGAIHCMSCVVPRSHLSTMKVARRSSDRCARGVAPLRD